MLELLEADRLITLPHGSQYSDMFLLPSDSLSLNVVDTADGVIMISLEGGCTGCSATPMTAMQIYYSLMKLEDVNDVVFVNGELPAYMRAFIDDKLEGE